ncbi:MAG: DUF748 domain-containing protein [Proteobacteria bacterium]|nr:DUF748 domain-containing protein [Pseudomonadota bacterium]
MEGLRAPGFLFALFYIASLAFTDSIAAKALGIGCSVSQVVQGIKSHRWVRRAAWLVAGLLGFWLLAWLAVPPIARAQIEKHASEALGRKVTVAKVEFEPWSLEATVRGLAIASQDGQSPQVQVGRIYIDAELQSLWRLAPVIDALQVDDPVIHVTQTAPGKYDVDDVLARLAQQPQSQAKPSSPLRFALYNIALRGGVIEFDDRTVDKIHELRQLTLNVPFLSNFAADREVKVTPRLAFELNGSSFDSAAQSTPFAQNRQTDLKLQVHGFDLAPFAGYLPESVPVRLKAGRLSADLKLDFAQAEATPQLKISGAVQLQGVQTTDAAGQPLLSFEALQVALNEVQPLRRMVDVAAVDWTGVRAHVGRDAKGALTLPGLDRQSAGEEAKTPPATGAQEAVWQLRLGRLGLHDATVDWVDASLPGGKAVWKAENLQLQASAIELPFKQPLQFRASARLSGGGARGEAARLAVAGQATDVQAQAAVSIRGLPLAMAAPYLAGVLKPTLGGMLDADLGLARNGGAMAAKVASLSLDKLALSCAADDKCQTLRRAGIVDAGKTSVAELGRLEVGDSLALLPQRRLTLGRVLLRQPKMFVSRAHQGDWMFEQWLADKPQPHPAHAASSKAEAPWTLKLAALEIDGASLAFRDEVPVRPVALNASGLQLRVRDFSFVDGRLAPTAVQLETRVTAGRIEPGRLHWEGSVAMDPALAVQGQLRAQHLPLQAFEPYVTSGLNVDILRADGSFAGKLRYVQEKAGPLVAVAGDASLDEVRVRAKDEDAGDGQDERTTRVAERGEELLRWKSLALRGLAVNLKPGQPLALDVQQTALSDFFARVIVHENGRINLQDIQKGAEPSAGNASGAAATAQAAPAPVPAAPVVDPMAPVIRFGPVTLTNGSVRFSDFFIKPNYSADLSELRGSLSAFSSVPAVAGAEPQMADLELHGRAQGTASLEVTGKLNPLAKPLALDIQGHMRDLELPPLSPYSIKYSGHGIERGKLSMDVAYKVLPDGQLTANNKLVLHQLAFGDAVEGAPASLPVRLAVALLADRNGVIDVDLPISGSLNDPQFSLGGVILKVIGNLIMKAVTAPFSLLAGMFGGADESGVVHFAPGSSALDDKARQLLDKIGEQLVNRPALKLTVVGWAQPQAEQPAWKRLRLRDLAQAQKRRDAVRAGESAADVPPVSDAEYPALLKEAYQRADIKKPRNLIGIAKDVPQAEMEALLLQSITVPDNAMPDLALARGVAVRDYLASRQVPLDRLFVGAAKLQPAGEGETGWTPKAELVLATR